MESDIDRKLAQAESELERAKTEATLTFADHMHKFGRSGAEMLSSEANTLMEYVGLPFNRATEGIDRQIADLDAKLAHTNNIDEKRSILESQSRLLDASCDIHKVAAEEMEQATLSFYNDPTQWSPSLRSALGLDGVPTSSPSTSPPSPKPMQQQQSHEPQDWHDVPDW